MLHKCIKKSLKCFFTSTDNLNLFFTSRDNLKMLCQTFSFWFIAKTVSVPCSSRLVLYTTSTDQNESSNYHFFPDFTWQMLLKETQKYLPRYFMDHNSQKYLLKR